MSRPEHISPPDVFYNEEESTKYSSNSRIIKIQRDMSDRALELLALPPSPPRLLLDIGCGSGLSGELITENGHHWVGLDISSHMLNVARDREVEGDMILKDMGEALPFRPGVFDGAISISALQWLCNADKSSHNPRKRIQLFFQSLYHCLARGAKAVFQWYPENPSQMELITSSAMRCGFTGGLLIDYPNSSKAKKYFLVLFSGPSSSFTMPQALGTEEGAAEPEQIGYSKDRLSRHKADKGKHRKPVKDKDWVLKKKDQQRDKGKKVRHDSKYTARSRGPKF